MPPDPSKLVCVGTLLYSWALFFYKQAYDNYSKNIGDNVFKCIVYFCFYSFECLGAWLLTMDGLKSFVPFYFHVLRLR